MKPKVLITDSVHPVLIEGITQKGFEVVYQPEISFDEVLNVVGDYFGIIINTKIKAHKALIDKAVKLKFIARLGSGMEIIDVPYANQKGILCVNSPEGNRNAVAEQAMGMLLCLISHIHSANQEVKQGKWNREANRGEELEGKTIGILGFGHTGSIFAKRLSSFDVRILAFDKYKTGFGSEAVEEATMEDLYNEADVLSIHLPLTDETEYLVDERFLNQFKKPIFLLNTARGKIINTLSMMQSVEKGIVKAAALDVLENEQINNLPESDKIWFEKLINDRRIMLSPHIAGWTFESKKKIAEIVLQKIDGVLRNY